MRSLCLGTRCHSVGRPAHMRTHARAKPRWPARSAPRCPCRCRHGPVALAGPLPPGCPPCVITVAPWTAVVQSPCFFSQSLSCHSTCTFHCATSSRRAHSACRRGTPPCAIALPGIRIPLRRHSAAAGLVIRRTCSCHPLALSSCVKWLHDALCRLIPASLARTAAAA